MDNWRPEWGNRPDRTVTRYWWPPSLLLRQAASVASVGVLSRWKLLPEWLLAYGFRCLPGAAGSLGMGCIGFPAHAVWEITERCNLSCIHCHVANRRCGTELSTDEGKNLLSELSAIREFRMVAFTGGEPLLRQDLFELLAFSEALGFTNTMATNATMMDDGTARDLKRHGVSIAAVSLDGDRETHDNIRGRAGAFEAAVGGMQAIVEAGIVLHINVTAMEHNLAQLAELVDLSEKLGAGIILFYQLVPVGRGRAISAATLPIEEHEKLIKFMVRVQRRSRAVIEPVAGPQYWAELLRDSGVGSGPRLTLAERVFHGCSAGRGFVYVKSDGEVLPCPFIDVSCGNVRGDKFSDIWANSEVLDDLRNREDRLKGACGECEYRSLCGGCRGRAWASTGDYLAHDPSCFLNPEQTTPRT